MWKLEMHMKFENRLYYKVFQKNCENPGGAHKTAFLEILSSCAGVGTYLFMDFR